jgi:hypothetical protein
LKDFIGTLKAIAPVSTVTMAPAAVEWASISSTGVFEKKSIFPFEQTRSRFRQRQVLNAFS